MDKKHPEGFWVNQLTDQQLDELLQLINKNNKNVIYKSILKKENKKNGFKITYHLKRLHCYISYTETSVELHDFSISKNSALKQYVDYMTDLFGEDYIADLNSYVENLIINKPEDKSIPSLLKIKESIMKNELTTAI